MTDQPSPRAAHRPRRWPRHRLGRLDAGTATLVVLVTAGIAIRLGFWWQDRPFWRDEVGLLQSLDTYSWAGLFGPLADAQAAPPLWLWTQRAVTLVAGVGERAYRLVPVLAASVALVLLAVLAVRMLRRRWVALIPVALAATEAEVVFYGAQAKQYTTDLLLVTGLLLLGLAMLRGRPPLSHPHSQPPEYLHGHSRGWATLVAWYGALTLFPWFSHGAMLTVPLVAAWVTLLAIRHGQLTIARATGLLVIPALSTLGAALLAQSLTSRVDDFTTYWADYLGPGTLDLGAWGAWHAFVVPDLAIRVLGAPIWSAALVMVAVGLFALWRRDRVAAILLVLPLVAAYLAGVAGLYPFGRRLLLFVLPSLLVPLGAFVDAVVDTVTRLSGLARARFRPRVGAALPRWPVEWASGLIAAALVAVTCWTTPMRLGDELRFQYGVDDYRTAFAWVADHWEDGDILLVGNGDRAALRVYGPRVGLPADQLYRAMPAPSTRERDDCPLPSEIDDAARAWLVTGDQVPLYAGVTSRYGIVAPLIGRFHPIYQHVRGQVTVQLVEAERPRKPENAQTARCLTYAPLGEAGDPTFPPALPTR